MVFATVPVAHFGFVSGASKVGRFRSSGFGERQFCTACGTPLAMQVTHQPETIDITVTTLDAPETVAPGFHIFYASRIAWFETTDSLPKHEKFRPGTRGLEGTDPPV